MRTCLVVMLIVSAAGCSIRGGPVMGYRGGRPTVGWEAGPGIMDDSGQGTQVHVDGGQMYRDGRMFSYGALSAQHLSTGTGDQFGGLGGQIGVGGGDDGASLVLGGSGIVGSAQDPGCGPTYWSATLSAGVRWIDGGTEIFVAPRFDAMAVPCF